MNPQRTEVDLLYLEVAPADIAPVKFLFESYEGVAVVRTLHKREAVIVVLVAPDFAEVAAEIVASLKQEFGIRLVERPDIATDDWLVREVEEVGVG